MVLNDQKRSEGGKARAAAQQPWEKRFLAMLGGSARPRTKDTNLSPPAAQFILETEAAQYPWLMLALVGRDGRSISSRWPKEKIIEEVKQAGGVVGMVGLIFFNKGWTVYKRPFLTGKETKSLLDVTARKYLAVTTQAMRREIEATTEGSPVSALVWAEGDRVTLVYDWREGRMSGPGAYIGVVYLAKTDTGKLQLRFQALAEEFADQVRDAASRFRSDLERIQNAASNLEANN